MGNLCILSDYVDFLVYNSEAYLFSSGKEVFYFDLVDICFSYILYKLYKLRCGVWVVYEI